MFGSDMSSFPTIRNYNDALYVYENIKPIRGSNNVRRFAKRNQTQFTVEKETDGTIAFYCHDTPCVKVTPKNIVEIKTGGWDTLLTSRFIGNLLIVVTYFKKNSVLVRSTLTTKKYTNYYALIRVNSNEPVKFKFEKNDLVYVSGAIPMTKTVLNKDKCKKLTNKWEEVFKTARAYSTLSNHEYVLQVPYERVSIPNNLKSVPKTEEIPQFLLNFIAAYGLRNYSKHVCSMTYSSLRSKLIKELYKINNVYDNVKLLLGEWE